MTSSKKIKIGLTAMTVVVTTAALPAVADRRGETDHHRGRHHRQARKHDASDGYLDVYFRIGSRHRHHHGRRSKSCEMTKCRVCVRGGYYERRWVSPVYELRYDVCGRSYQVLVCEGYYKKAWVFGRRVAHRCHHRTQHCGERHFHRFRRHCGFHVGVQWRF